MPVKTGIHPRTQPGFRPDRVRGRLCAGMTERSGSLWRALLNAGCERMYCLAGKNTKPMKNVVRGITFFGLLSVWALTAFAAERITAAYTSIAAAYAPFWVAKDKGIFDKYNFDARLIYMRGTVPTIAALANSELDFVQSGASPFIPYAAKGGDVVLLGCLANKVIDYVLIAHPSISSNRTTARQAHRYQPRRRPDPSLCPGNPQALRHLSQRGALGANRVAAGTGRRAAPRLDHGEHPEPTATICPWSKRAIKDCLTSRISSCRPACAA